MAARQDASAVAKVGDGLCESPRAATGVLFLVKQGCDCSRMVEQRGHQRTGQRVNAGAEPLGGLLNKARSWWGHERTVGETRLERAKP